MRAGRLVQVMRLLHTRGQMTMPELAAALEVSVRTVARDIEALSSAGVPVFTVRGVRGGVALLDDHNLEAVTGLSAAAPSGTPAGWATVRISPHGRRLAAVLGRPMGLRVRRRPPTRIRGEDWVEASLPFGSVDQVVPEILGLGPDIEVLRPVTLRRRVREVAMQVAAAHRGDDPRSG